MLEDQTKFGRSTFELYGMQRLQKLEVFVCQERLKLLGAIKITRELQHGKITKMLEQQALRGQCTLEEMEEEVYRSQLGIFDVSLEMLKEEEDILRRQKDILDRAWQEELDEGIFYDAVEERDQLEDELEMESSGPMSRRDRLKLRLNRLYRKRAILRNKREKVDILTELNAGKKQVDICKERDIAPSTVATILKDREKIVKLHREAQLAPLRKRLRRGNYETVDNAVFAWFKDARQHSVPLSGPIIQEKARQFAVTLGTSGFDASAGWLYWFRQRNGIMWQVACGEEKAAGAESAIAWRNERFQESVESFSPDDVFNADEL
ncbi:hypothetical protein HPB52_010701 [Rhipicephalus sanguineus]|uniref:HTH CENPB-type domain-containing protein n=1 Tax=Rhipicephalus sanguineus TaxID=34632 RepID=A0A9D4PZF0_RHISA|nr:hypothetical protein HPB52_010701 [Rhipicephalus sanguineus]